MVSIGPGFNPYSLTNKNTTTSNKSDLKRGTQAWTDRFNLALKQGYTQKQAEGIADSTAAAYKYDEKTGKWTSY